MIHTENLIVDRTLPVIITTFDFLRWRNWVSEDNGEKGEGGGEKGDVPHHHDESLREGPLN